MADALADAGHQRIAYIAGEAGSSTNQDRERGFTSRLRERGARGRVRRAGRLLVRVGLCGRETAAGAQADRPDAIFCANDLMAMAALDVARTDLGLRVPEDVSIVGFDDNELASWPKYDLTTVQQPVDRMVDATIEVLLQAIQQPQTEHVVRFMAPSLVVRSSARVALS